MINDKLINYKKLDKCVHAYEKLKKELDLDKDEEKLFLDILTDRRDNKYSKLKIDTYLGDLSGGLFKSMFKKGKQAIEEKEAQ